MARCPHALRLFLVLALSWAPAAAHAQSILIERDLEPGDEDGQFFALPFAFTSDVMGFAVGAVAGGRSLFQEQTVFAGSLIGSTNGSFATYLYAENFQLPLGDRLFASPRITYADLDELEAYRDGNPEFPLERAGDNDSDEDNFFEGEGSDAWYRVIFKYVLPLGHGRESPIHTYILERGLLAENPAGATSWNPIESGRSLIELEPFYREQEVDSDEASDVVETAGVSLRLRHENVDYLQNPSRGSVKQVRFTYDPGVSGRDSSYFVWEFEWAQYFDLGSDDWFRQKVLALNFWISDTPSWDEDGEGASRIVRHRPPNFVGATLGGTDRFRGYPTDRFSDKSAILYTAELRLIPEWNPLGNITWLKRFVRVEWWQIVPFVEVGRVSPHFRLHDLHTDLRWSAGLGIRASVNTLIVRADVAVSEEELRVQMMVAHPFPSL
jgi:hypothetical protein